MRRRPTGWRFCRSAPSRTSSCGPSWVGRAVRAISCRSWSSVSAQKTGTAGTPRRESSLAMRIVSRAFMSVKSRAREEADLLAGRDRDGAARGEVLGHPRGFAVPGDGSADAGTRARAPFASSSRPRSAAASSVGGSGRTPEGPRGSRGRVARARGTWRKGSRRASLAACAGRRARTMRRGESGPAGDPSKSPHVASTGSPARQKSVDELVRRVRPDALAEDLGRALAADLDLLLDALRLGVPGAADRVLLFAATSALFGDEAFEDPVASERIAEERSARPEHALDLGHDRDVLGPRGGNSRSS